jgi:transcriptional regulator with XRE-family HTH domain
MTLKELSENIGFTASQLNNYELGISYPKFLDLIKISNFFDVSEFDLIHKDLETDKTAKANKETLNDIIELQNKLIQMLEEKNKNLLEEVEELKKTLCKI